MLLPRQSHEEEDELDPRAELIRRLQQYERFKKAAEDIEALPRMERDSFPVNVHVPELPEQRVHPDVGLREILLAMREVMRRADMFEHHQIERERLSTRERMSQILERLQGERFVAFPSLFTVEEGRLGVVVSFLAILELIKEQLVEIVQTDVFAPIHLRARVHSEE